MKATCPVVVVFQNADTRAAAMAFCDRLVAQFWAKNSFEISWWSVATLAQEQLAQEALQKALDTGIIIFAMGRTDPMPFHLQNWVERWLAHRGEREGVLIDLSEQQPNLKSDSPLLQPYLRKVAHLAGMDYLTELPETILEPIPESADFFADRAEQMTSVLDEILHQRPGPPQIMP